MKIYSYVFDLRYALENYSTIAGIADFMDDRSYAFNHLIFLSDAEESKVLENNFSGTGVNMHRGLRSDDSILNTGVTWGFEDALACVNFFILEGNHDNHTEVISNTTRWDSINTSLDTKRINDGKITLVELKDIACFYTASEPGSLTMVTCIILEYFKSFSLNLIHLTFKSFFVNLIQYLLTRHLVLFQ